MKQLHSKCERQAVYVWRNADLCSCNHRHKGKAKIIRYFNSVFVRGLEI